MCESKIYLVDGEETHQIMENATQMQREGDVYVLVNLLGEQKLIRGQIVRVDFIDHVVYLERIPGEPPLL